MPLAIIDNARNPEARLHSWSGTCLRSLISTRVLLALYLQHASLFSFLSKSTHFMTLYQDFELSMSGYNSYWSIKM